MFVIFYDVFGWDLGWNPPPPPMTVTCPILTGLDSVGNYLNTCSLLPAQFGRGKEEEGIS